MAPRSVRRSRAADAALLLAGLVLSADAGAGGEPATPSLKATIAALDAEVFDAFNRCADPAQLERHADHFETEARGLRIVDRTILAAGQLLGRAHAR